MFDANHGRYLLPAFAILLIGLRYLFREGEPRRIDPETARKARAMLLALLAAAAALSVPVYNNFFNFHYGGYLNAYEFFHYYMGSKYFEEVGYFDMYNAAVVADAETGRWFRPADRRMTDLRTYRDFDVESVLQHGDQFRSLFSEGRWDEWVGDVDYFKTRIGPPAWNRILRDHGYNATPVWTMVSGSLSRNVSTASDGGMLALSLIDAALLAGAVVCVAWAFGVWPALLMMVFAASSYLMAHVHLKGAFLRTDFVVALVVAVCVSKKGKPALAGALIGYATMSRLFPVVFLVGPLAGLISEAIPAIRRGGGYLFRRVLDAVDRRRLRLFEGFAAAVVALMVGSVVYHGGFAAWSDFSEKIALHRAEPHIWNIGLSTLVNAQVEPPARSEPVRSQLERADGRPLPAPYLSGETVRGRRTVLIAIQIAAVIGSAFAARRLALCEAIAFGFVPLFILAAPTYYYYIVLLLPLLFFAGREGRRETIGLVYLFAFGMLGFAFYARWDQYFPTSFYNAALALGLALYMTWVAAAKRRNAQRSFM